ncbi:pilus assembly protein TadG-related protein [Streptomyces sp. NPDC090108]|uniref:pilus assembly protein TadG-related protein n=1 Tax=Streptomyces sp. NPDC090108 TaxID=3365947 RepID=UPI00381D3FC2
MAAGLLFLALAYLAVGQAAVNRSGAQSAADAAALAAAQNRRDQLAGQWVESLKDLTKWTDIFRGRADVTPSCWRADQLAAQNDAQLQNCDESQLLEITVEVRTNKPIGSSVVPGVSDRRSTESATAVIEPLCDFVEPTEDAEPPSLPKLTCDGKSWSLDPSDTVHLPHPEDLFDVHLSE